MSRGFVKEEDQETTPIIPPRAALPAGKPNYVTPRGLLLLNEEAEGLEKRVKELLKLESGPEKRYELALVEGKKELLKERINSARVINPEEHVANDVVRFGSTVKVHNQNLKTTNTFQIVGVDEADPAKQKISFVAPIAKALAGKKVGETVAFKLGTETRLLEILSVEYD